MKKIIVYPLFCLIFLSTSAFVYHKFYVGIFQIEYASEKKMLQITTRIFVDDLNKAIAKKYKTVSNIGTEKETSVDVLNLKKYLSENFAIKVNGQSKSITFLSKETEADDVLICYLRIKDISKIKNLEIFNAVLFDFDAEQQNITHVIANGLKKTVLFTVSSRKELLKYE